MSDPGETTRDLGDLEASLAADARARVRAGPGAGVTQVAQGPEHDAALVRERVVAQGLLDDAAASAALAAWRRTRAAPSGAPGGGPAAERPMSFASFLVARGLVDPGAAGALAPGVEEGGAIAAGERVSGCVLERELGRGGMGTVWRAHREESGEPVVVKFLDPSHVADPGWRARFAREGLVAQQVDDPRVVRVWAVEVAGPRPHIVMELVEGQDLAERLEAEGRLDPLEAARLGRDIALGLAAAHARGVIHRDVKPGNVRLTPDGRVKLLDFGLAKAVLLEDGLSVAGQVLGTPHYMPPEQWGDHRVDARGDVYSLGATLYHLVTGQPPFPGDRPMQICRKVLAGELRRPRELAPDVPPGLELAILRMLARDRRWRFPDGAAAARALDAALAGRDVEVPALRERGPGGARHPLLPGARFELGADPACEVVLAGEGVRERHACLELTAAGPRLRALRGQVRVGGVAVESAYLRPGDVVQLGALELVYDDAGLDGAARAREGGDAAPPLPPVRVRPVPWPVFDALVELGLPHVTLALIERLPRAPTEGEARAGAALVRELGLGGAVAEEVGQALDARLRRRRGPAVEALFRATHENLGLDAEAWLAWWDDARATLPPQVAPDGLPPRWAVLVDGEGPISRLELPPRLVLTVGRGPECDVRLVGPSVSRKHATLLRLDRRLVVRDERSRFGTLLDGDAVRLAFVAPGARVALGRTTLTLEQDPEPDGPRTAGGDLLVDGELFEALVDVGHPSTVAALARLARAEETPWLEPLAASLTPQAPRARQLVALAREGYARRAAAAVERLAALLPGDAPAAAAPADWAALVERRRPALPPQVAPLGWLPGWTARHGEPTA